MHAQENSSLTKQNPGRIFN